MNRERWNSPEIEEYMEGSPERSSLNTGEMIMIRDLILYPHLLTMAQREMDKLKYADMVFKPLYESVTRLLMGKVNADMKELKTRLAKRQIRLNGDHEYNEETYSYPYVCRGYQHNFYMVRHVMAVQVRLFFTEYFSDIFGEISEKMNL